MCSLQVLPTADRGSTLNQITSLLCLGPSDGFPPHSEQNPTSNAKFLAPASIATHNSPHCGHIHFLSLSLYTLHTTPHSHFIHSLHTLYTLYNTFHTHITHSIHITGTYSIHTLDIHSTHTNTYILYTHYPYILYTHTVYALHTHSLHTLHTFYTNTLHTHTPYLTTLPPQSFTHSTHTYMNTHTHTHLLPHHSPPLSHSLSSSCTGLLPRHTPASLLFPLPGRCFPESCTVSLPSHRRSSSPT